MGDATTLLFGLDGFRVVSVGVEEQNDQNARVTSSSGSPRSRGARRAGC